MGGIRPAVSRREARPAGGRPDAAAFRPARGPGAAAAGLRRARRAPDRFAALRRPRNDHRRPAADAARSRWFRIRRRPGTPCPWQRCRRGGDIPAMNNLAAAFEGDRRPGGAGEGRAGQGQRGRAEQHRSPRRKTGYWPTASSTGGFAISQAGTLQFHQDIRRPSQDKLARPAGGGMLPGPC
jgi:hypothetical protein